MTDTNAELSICGKMCTHQFPWDRSSDLGSLHFVFQSSISEVLLNDFVTWHASLSPTYISPDVFSSSENFKSFLRPSVSILSIPDYHHENIANLKTDPRVRMI